MEINGYTKMAAVVANPIKHSLSPMIHNKAFELIGENGVYLAWEIEDAENDQALEQVLSNIRLLDMYGINLSMPYKKKAMKYVDELTESAALIGAINTIINQNGQLIGHNTDGIGFFRSLKDVSFEMENHELTILGSGGAATAIIAQAALLGAKKINVFNRKSTSYIETLEKIALLTKRTGVDIVLYDLANEEKLAEKLKSSNLLVNATSVGMDGLSSPIPSSISFPSQMIVADVIYKELETPLLKRAKARGNQTVNGVGMLLYQAAEAFEAWTGKVMPTDLIKKDLEKIFEK